MNVNWRVRLVNRTFWVSIIPAILLVVQLMLDLVGIEMDFGEWGNKLVAIVDAIFIVLSIMGIVNDPTTEGLNDSVRAMTYDKPQ